VKAYRIVPTRVFTKDFRRLSPEAQQRILDALEKMQQDPYQGRNVLAVKTGTWRWRAGDYRIRYDIEGEDVVLLHVRHRREVYRD
jgi:mRNA interferase RelE/StbE